MPRTSHSVASGLFPTGVFAAAFLLFAVQPMVGKRVLPWFGGVPSVWALCLAFYQTALLLGYAYAHGLSTWVRPGLQPWVHATLFLGALAVLPVLPGAEWTPDGPDGASGRILSMLAANVALPFALLAATSPLVQAWFARGFPERSPYALYAVSNLGSLLALLSYPTLIEPTIAVSRQSTLWSWAFVGTGVLVLASAFWASQRSGVVQARSAEDPGARVPTADVALWLLLPAAAVALLMGVTNALCLDVASVPFLWIVPLSIYLVSLILTFASERAYHREAMLVLAALTTLLLVGTSQLPETMVSWKTFLRSLPSRISLYSFALFLACMVAHGELYRLRPTPARLTSFYLVVAAGGAMGGLFVSLVAPRIFVDYHELPLAAGLVAVGAAVSLWRARRRISRVGRLASLSAGVLALAATGIRLAPTQRADLRIVFAERNFFGTLRVVEQREPRTSRLVRALRNGTTRHGHQFQSGPARVQPTSYYGRLTGIGFALGHRAEQGPMRVGVIGLGIGTLAAYGRESDTMTFYEIDPDVVHIARDTNWFTYLRDAAGEVEIVVGDARLSLESEAPRGFDVLALDAFSSDAVPTHLLTREAFSLYGAHLLEGGTLAVNVSNRHFDLPPLVAALGQTIGLHALVVQTAPIPQQWTGRSLWVLLNRDASLLDELESRVRRKALDIRGDRLRSKRQTRATLGEAPLWSDDYSDLFRLVKRD